MPGSGIDGNVGFIGGWGLGSSSGSDDDQTSGDQVQ